VKGVVFQNEPDAPPALLEDWLRERELPAETVEVWEQGMPDDPSRFGWVVALGAYNSVTDSEPGWIPAQVDFLRDAVAAQVPVFGICFGGQALSLALGGEISARDPLSFGWFETRTRQPDVVPAGPWVHFNFEQFSVPDGATLLAESPGGPGAFRIGPHLGVQFHPEATPEIIDKWAEDDAERIARHGYFSERIREQGRLHGPRAKHHAFALFDAWWAMHDGGRST
jgi:GMP synthase-like glutamine amidotransferase